jgi:GNAT superfamily N-acetyltransferase
MREPESSVSGGRPTRSGVEIAEGFPTPEEYNRLRAAVGWGIYEPAVIAEALPQSLYGVYAYDHAVLVGMARVIGDGGLVYYVQDVIVIPEYQGLGIGGALMDRVMTYIRMHASHNSIIGLMAAQGKEGFYERYGFVARTERLGSGMTMSWRMDRQTDSA